MDSDAPDTLIGRYFRYRRTAGDKRFSHTDVQRLLGWSQPTLSRLETGLASWNSRRMEQAAKLLGFRGGGPAFHREAILWNKRKDKAA